MEKCKKCGKELLYYGATCECKDRKSDSGDDGLIGSIIDVGIGIGLSNLFDRDDSPSSSSTDLGSSSSDDSSFGGFGGGDFGGSGADGNW